MKKLFFVLPLFFTIISFYFFNLVDYTNRTSTGQNFLLDGTDGERDLRPYEWEYLKRTFPYLDADPRAYLDAIEQANLLKRETDKLRLAKGQSDVQ